MIHDRVRFNLGSWTVMLSKALDKYNDTVHSSTKNETQGCPRRQEPYGRQGELFKQKAPES